MAILNFKLNQIGETGQTPNFIYFETNDTLADVTVTGYLNKFVQQGNLISETQLAVVSTKTTPNARSSSVGIFNVTYDSGNWSLTADTSLLILPDGKIFVGNSSDVATAVTMSGDATMDNTGLLTIANNAVTTAKIADANVTTAKILDANITTAKIADVNVTTAKIADSNITTAKIADANVTTAKIADANVTTVKILDANVTTAKIADANVTLAKLASGITPASITKFSGKHNDGGGFATISIPVVGALATDIAFVCVQESTNAVSVQKALPGTDTIDVTLSADPGAATVLSWQLLRVAS